MVLFFGGEAGADLYAAFGAGDKAVGGGAFHEEDVAGDDGVVAEGGVAAEDGAVGVDDDVVFDGGVALDVFDGAAVFVEGEAFGAEGDALVEFDVIADMAGFTDDDAGAVVDEKAGADGGTGVDVDAGEGVDAFAHDAGDEGEVEAVELVGEAVGGDCEEAGIGEFDFGVAEGGGVAVVGGLYVGDERLSNGGKGLKKGFGELCGGGLRVVEGGAVFV